MSLRPTGVLLRCPVLPSTGTSPDYPMSQKAVTEALAGKVPTSRTINGKPLSSNLTLNSTDVSALPLTGGTITGQTTFKVNGATPKVVVERPDADTNISLAFKGKTKTLHFGKGPDGHLYYAESENIATGAKLYSSSNKPTAAELGLPSNESFTAELTKKVDKTAIVQATGTSTTNIMSQKAVTDQLATKVPTSRTINGKPLSANISLTAADVDSYNKSETTTLIDSRISARVVQATGTSTDNVMSQKAATDQINSRVPTSRTINGKPLTSNVSLVAGDVNAFTKEEVTSMINALPRLLGGTAEPTAATGKAGDWYIVY